MPNVVKNVKDKDMTYTVRMAMKTPSSQVQYRMLEADVSVTGNDPYEVTMMARRRLIMAIITMAEAFGETPPAELREAVAAEYDEEVAQAIYGEIKVD